MKMSEQQSQELEPKKRFAQVAALQKKLEDDAARPLLDWKLDYFVHRPFVKNLIPHQSIYNFGRMQEVWRAKYPHEAVPRPTSRPRPTDPGRLVHPPPYPAAPGARR